MFGGFFLWELALRPSVSRAFAHARPLPLERAEGRSRADPPEAPQRRRLRGEASSDSFYRINMT